MRRSILIRRIEDEYCIQADNAEEAIDAWCELFLLYNRKKNTSILYNDYNEIIKDLEDKLNKANCKIVEIMNKCNDLFESQEKYNKISDDNKIITKAYNDVVQKLDSCKNRIIYLETSNVDLVKKDDKYQNEIKKLKKELRNKQNVIDKNLILLSKIDEYKSKNADLESKNYYNIKEIESVCEKIIQLEEENNQLKQKLEFINKTKEAVYKNKTIEELKAQLSEEKCSRRELATFTTTIYENMKNVNRSFWGNFIPKMNVDENVLLDLCNVEELSLNYLLNKNTYEVGDSFTFGKYPQNSDGIEKPIEWIVIKVYKDEIMIISKLGLDCKKYHKCYKNITWNNCTLRQYLNNEFYDMAFDSYEKELVVKHNQDLVTILDEAEYAEFPSKYVTCKPTKYSIQKGVEVMGNSVSWIMRTGRSTSLYLPVVYFDGSPKFGIGPVNSDGYAVRPIIYLKIIA